MPLVVLSLLLGACGAKPPAQHTSARPDSVKCASADASLPAFTAALGSKVAGRVLPTCAPDPKSGAMKSGRFRFTPQWIRIAAVDGVPLPARVNLDPTLPRGLQRISDCSVQSEVHFSVQVYGRWYATRAATCTTDL